jgi:cobaltochelatase CobS
MGAIKAPTIVGIKHNTDTDSADYTYLKVNGEPRTTQLRWADRSTLMAIGKYCNAFAGKGTPVGMDKSDMLNHVQVRIKELGEKNNYVPQPFMEPSPTAKVVLNSAPRQAEPKGSSIDDAVKQLMESMLASGVMTPPTTQIDPAQIEALQAQIDDLQLQVANRPAPVVIVNNGVTSKPTVGVVHAKYADIAKAMMLRMNVYLVGPAGTGKSTIPQQIAEQMGLEFSAVSCGTTDAKFDYVGFRDGHGVLHSTSFRDRYENGGVMLLDEMDNASPDVLVTLNQALSNGIMAFPDKMVKKHPDFILVAAGNTYGSGATAQYVGRSPIDAATMNRFIKFVVGVDENIENEMVASTGLLVIHQLNWLGIIRKARANCEASGLRVMVTPRDAKHGASLLHLGFTVAEAIDMTFGFGLEGVQRDKVLAGVTL